MTKRIAELEAAQRLAEEQRKAEVAKAKAELEAALSSEKAKANDLARQGKDYLQEIGGLRERNQELEAEMAKVARVGKREEMDFADEARSWPGIWVGEKLPRNGDYLMAFADAAGNALEPSMVIDNKDKATVAEADVRKLVRDAKERKLAVAVLVTRDESQLRQADRQRRWGQEDGIWLLRSTRAWLPRDLEVLRPVFERMRAEGPDFLQRNAALADEVRRTLADIDEIEGQLKKAEAAIGRRRRSRRNTGRGWRGCATAPLPQPEEGPMWFMCERLLVDLLRSDSVFLRSAGIEPCVIDDPCPGPPPLHRERQARLTEKDAKWLRACGVAWEREPAVQLPLDFCGRQEAVQETLDSCGGSHEEGMQQLQRNGKCPQCKGTGRLGYPGYGQVDAYKTPCLACQSRASAGCAGAPDRSKLPDAASPQGRST